MIFTNFKEASDWSKENDGAAFTRTSDGKFFTPANSDKTVAVSTHQEDSIHRGSMRLEEAEVDILFIVKDDQVSYINGEADHLFHTDKNNEKKLIGRVVNFVFTGQVQKNKIEVFVAFDDQDSSSMFTFNLNRDERLNYVCQALFKSLGINVFSPSEQYATEYLYTFKLYQKGHRYFMVNNSQTQAYLIDENSIKRDRVDEIKADFWKSLSHNQKLDSGSLGAFGRLIVSTAKDLNEQGFDLKEALACGTEMYFTIENPEMDIKVPPMKFHSIPKNFVADGEDECNPVSFFQEITKNLCIIKESLGEQFSEYGGLEYSLNVTGSSILVKFFPIHGDET